MIINNTILRFILIIYQKKFLLNKNKLFVIVDEYWSIIGQDSYFYFDYNIYPTITIATIWKKKEKGRKK